MSEPLVRDTTWMRDDCQCRTVSPDGDGCSLSADYTTGLCAHCQGHVAPPPASGDAALLLTDGLVGLIDTLLRKYGGTMKGRGDHDIYDSLVRFRKQTKDYRAAALIQPPAEPTLDVRVQWAVLWLYDLIRYGRVTDLAPDDEYVRWATEARDAILLARLTPEGADS
jgi:hypothetical protein